MKYSSHAHLVLVRLSPVLLAVMKKRPSVLFSFDVSCDFISNPRLWQSYFLFLSKTHVGKSCVLLLRCLRCVSPIVFSNQEQVLQFSQNFSFSVLKQDVVILYGYTVLSFNQKYSYQKWSQCCTFQIVYIVCSITSSSFYQRYGHCKLRTMWCVQDYVIYIYI